MSRTFVFLLLAATAAAAPPLMKGAVLACYARGCYSTPASAAVVREMAATGITHVELMATYYVANTVNATAIFADAAKSQSDDDVLAAIAALRASNITVSLKPHIDSLDGVWRANIGTGFTSEAQWDEWFENYTSFVLHFCALAVRGGASGGFNVGTELDGTHAREAQWRALIASARAALPPGTPLWLGPNWRWAKTPGYRLVGFWDALDFLGVDMYAPLSTHNDPTLAEAEAGWAAIMADLAAFSQEHGGKQFIVRGALQGPGARARLPHLRLLSPL